MRKLTKKTLNSIQGRVHFRFTLGFCGTNNAM
jgi:hypothetical protein